MSATSLVLALDDAAQQSFHLRLRNPILPRPSSPYLSPCLFIAKKVVASSERHRTGLERFIAPKLNQDESGKTSFLTLEGVEGLLRDLAPSAEMREKVVRGYVAKSTSGASPARKIFSKLTF